MADSTLGDATELFHGRPCCCCGGGGLFGCCYERYVITDQFIERETGCVCKKIENLQMIRVKDLAYSQTCCCCCACGTIVVYSTDTTCPEMRIKGIRNGREVYQRLRNAVNRTQGRGRLELSQQ